MKFPLPIAKIKVIKVPKRTKSYKKIFLNLIFSTKILSVSTLIKKFNICVQKIDKTRLLNLTSRINLYDSH